MLPLYLLDVSGELGFGGPALAFEELAENAQNSPARIERGTFHLRRLTIQPIDTGHKSLLCLHHNNR